MAIEGLKFVGTLVMRAEMQQSAAVKAVAHRIRYILTNPSEETTRPDRS